MLRSIKIHNQINCDYICHFVQQAINDYHKHSQDIDGALLIIDIKKPSQENDESIRKLEHKNQDD